MTRSEFKVVTPGTSLAPEIAALETQCFSEPMSEARLTRLFAEPSNRFLAALTNGGEAAGYIGMTVVLDEGYVVNVAVAPDYRRLGVGKALITAALELGKREGLSFLTLEVRESNEAARRLYGGCGFIEVGRRNNYYVNEDAILMTYFFEARQDDNPIR